MKLTVREWLLADIPAIVSYFTEADEGFLKGMGAEKAKLPTRADWEQKLRSEFEKPLEEKSFFYIIWLAEGQPVGHCNIDKIQFGETATMHLHIWNTGIRKQGMGTEFVCLSIPYFFQQFNLQVLAYEPFAENPAPNRTLVKAGFQFVQSIYKTPGWINFPQTVNRYELTQKAFEQFS